MSSQTAQVPLEYLLAAQQRYWVNRNRISPSITYQICNKLKVDVNFDLQKYRNYVGIIDRFIDGLFKNQLYGNYNLSSGYMSNSNVNDGKKSKDKCSQNNLYVCLLQWINSLIFNIVAINDEYKQQVSHSISLSQSSSHHNPQLNNELVQSLQHSCSQCLQYLLTMPSLYRIISSISKNTGGSPQTHIRHELQHAILSTVSYIMQKFNLQLTKPNITGELIQQKLAVLGECQCMAHRQQQINSNMVHPINQLLFGNRTAMQSPVKLENGCLDYSIKELQQKLNKNYNANLTSIASLVDANYYSYDTVRPIFQNTQMQGHQFIRHLVSRILKPSQYNKNELFTQKMLQVDRLFQLLLEVVQYRHMSVLASWSYIITQYLHALVMKMDTNTHNHKLVHNICNFLYNLNIYHIQFVDILQYIYEQLSHHKYSKSVSMDIIKKFVLNRFLLNPTLYFHYIGSQYSQEQLAPLFNQVRLLFYPKKNNRTILKMVADSDVERIQSIFIHIVTSSNNNKGNSNYSPSKSRGYIENQNRKSGIYQLDRTLANDYEIIYNDLFNNYGSMPTNNNNKNNYNSNKSKDQSYDISFSFVTQNISRQGKQVYPSKVIRSLKVNTQSSQQNKNNNMILNLQSNNVTQFGSPVSQKSKKTVHTQYSQTPGTLQRQLMMIQQLVSKRRNLGQSKKNIDQKRAKRMKERQKFMYHFLKTHNDFSDLRRQIESLSNKIRLEIKLI